MSWILTVLLMIFMFCCGVAVVSFPWILMGRNTSYSQMFSNTLYCSGVVQPRAEVRGADRLHQPWLPDDVGGGAELQPHPRPPRHWRPLPLLLRGVRRHDALHRYICAGDRGTDVPIPAEVIYPTFNTTHKIYYIIYHLINIASVLCRTVIPGRKAPVQISSWAVDVQFMGVSMSLCHAPAHGDLSPSAAEL